MPYSIQRYQLQTRTVLPALLIVIAVLVVTGGGCASTSSKTPFMESQENVTFSTNELRVRLYDYANNFAGAVEQTADGIAAATEDPVIQRRTLQWKINAVAAVYQAAFRPDPLGAYTDVWAFSKQMSNFLESGAGRDLFGDWQPEAVATARILERNAHALGQRGTRSGDISGLEAKLDPWIEAHPLKDLHFIRESTTPFWADFVTTTGGGMQVVGRMEDSMLDMVSRLDILAENLRKQARWETELLMGEVLATDELEQFLARVDTMDVNLERIRVVFDEIEPILARQIQALLIVGGELTERERILAQEYWALEREILLARIEKMQVDAFEQLAAERVKVMSEIELSADRTVEKSLQRTRSLIDHLVWRIAQLAAGLLVMLVLTILAAWRWKNRTV